MSERWFGLTEDIVPNHLITTDVEAMGVDSRFFQVDVSGAANVIVFGEAHTQDVGISGAARYDAEGLETREATIRVSGAGLARVRVRDRLDANVSGAAVIEYWGDPQVTVIGGGTLRRMGP